MFKLGSLLNRNQSGAQKTEAPTAGNLASITDYWPTQGWRHAEPAAVGMDPAKVEQFRRELKREYQILSCLVVRRGHLAVEHHRNGEDDLQLIHSITKSVLSALIGIAIGRGELGGVSQRLAEFFPEIDGAGVDPRLQRVTLEHLLTMTAGLGALRRPINAIEDWGPGLAGTEMLTEPGQAFLYDSFGTHILSAVLQRVTGTDARAYAMKHLFGPLGIETVGWQIDTTGVRSGASGMTISAGDLAKFGLLYQRQGQWDGAQVVPEDWVRTSTQPHYTDEKTGSQYGYLWWILRSTDSAGQPGGFAALGARGQYVYVRPADDLVVVIMSDMVDTPRRPLELINKHLIPALQAHI